MIICLLTNDELITNKSFTLICTAKKIQNYKKT